MKKKVITRSVLILSLVSLFTDVASESLYPVMPVFLKSIGFSVLWIGLLEGMAEAVAGLSKGYFGKLSDNTGKRLPFVRWGYFLSAISKPLMAVSVIPLWIFLVRVTDRIGKGLRTAPRDAVLSAEATPETKGRVFGFHRALDTFGAVVGPLLALVFLYHYPQAYKTLFLLAVIPGCIAVILTFILREPTTSIKTGTSVGFLSFVKYWREGPQIYRLLVGGLVFFTLINSSDLFLLLRAKETGLSDTEVIGVYIFYNLVYAMVSYPAGVIADRVGLLAMLIGGIAIFALVYTGMAYARSLYWYAGLFLLYGIYAACTESIAKALISNVTRKQNMATALGTFNAFQSIATLISSAVAGLLWYAFGAETLFAVTGVLAAITVIYFIVLSKTATFSIEKE